MTEVVGRVVRERAERERVLLEIARVVNQRLDEIARPDVVHEVAEEMVAERVVAEILDDRSAVRERARVLEVVGASPAEIADAAAV